VLWIWGLAGSGKSTLATTIAGGFDGLHHLGTFVLFNQDVKEQSNPATVIQTLASQLGCSDAHIGSVISNAIGSKPHIVDAVLTPQFSRLLVCPLLSMDGLAKEGPVMLVINSLDDCGKASDSQLFLRHLLPAVQYLPPWIYIIITSSE